MSTMNAKGTTAAKHKRVALGTRQDGSRRSLLDPGDRAKGCSLSCANFVAHLAIKNRGSNNVTLKAGAHSVRVFAHLSKVDWYSTND